MKPKTLDDFPDLKAARKHYQELGGMLAAAQKDYDEKVRELGASTSAESSNGKRSLRAAELAAAGQGGVAVDVIDSVSATVLREKISELHEEVATLHEAIQLKRRIVDQLQADASRSICESLTGEYETIIGNIASALLALSDAVTKEFAFRAQLQEHGVQFSLPTVALHSMRINSNRDMNDTSASRAMKEIIENYPQCTRWRSNRK